MFDDYMITATRHGSASPDTFIHFLCMYQVTHVLESEHLPSQFERFQPLAVSDRDVRTCRSSFP
ncbi:hypothetical protein M404DRAFT_1007625 [Pisolithus tinctorius Marx 270]|uniref:Uncharacterized protein n=1 Tax=Pisolithus tinctorius Marx 270 TaxID=870435 RepID=A0A0C3JCH1_PISTI|nr:hypothetical protein M404DRAFT_1007625 [Pisolithus tinctorius Marx 270]